MNALNRIAGRWLLPVVLLGLLWVVVTQGTIASWVVGLPGVVLSVVAFDRLRGGRKLWVRLWQLPVFVVWFIWNSLQGGTDVAWRALQPRMPLRPGFVRYPVVLPPGPARIFLVNCVSLLPGTLCADLVDGELVVHALDVEADVIAGTREVERRVGKLFGIVEQSAHG